MRLIKLLIKGMFCCWCVIGQISGHAIIRNKGKLLLGDSIACFSFAKILSIKYGLPCYHTDFFCSDLFMFDIPEKRLSSNLSKLSQMRVKTEDDVLGNRNRSVALVTDINTRINYVSPEELAVLKKNLQLKEIPLVKASPSGIITVAVHIRKGNGGGQRYDGEQESLQEFDFDRTQVCYRTDYENFPFDRSYYQRQNGFFVKDHESDSSKGRIAIDNIPSWATKFPPNQFYIDQIKKLSDDLHDLPLFVSICTDDKNPELLVQKFKQLVNKPTIVFDYENYRNLPYREQMWRDLYILSRCDVLIRSQSYFTRAAELMGNHKMVIYPLKYRWEGNKLIMCEVVIKGSIQDLWKR